MGVRYIYQRRGGPLLSWAGGPPSQTRAADAKSLGSLGDFTSPPGNVFGLPMPGSPEFLGGYEVVPSSSPPIGQRGIGDVNCKCGGSCGCSGGLGDDASSARVIDGAVAVLGFMHGRKQKGAAKWLELGIAAYFGYKAMKG